MSNKSEFLKESLCKIKKDLRQLRKNPLNSLAYFELAVDLEEYYLENKTISELFDEEGYRPKKEELKADKKIKKYLNKAIEVGEKKEHKDFDTLYALCGAYYELGKRDKAFEYGVLILKDIKSDSYLKPKIITLLCHKLIKIDHFEHEEIIRELQLAKEPMAIPFIQKAIEVKPQLSYLDYDDYGAFYKKCLWALKDIGTSEAIKLIEEYTNSKDEALKKEAVYRMEKINHKRVGN